MATGRALTAADDALTRALREALGAGAAVRSDRLSRAIYATDASIYQAAPLAVVEPRHAGDVAATLEVARARGVPIVARGAGTSLAGQCVGASGIVLDYSRSMNHLLEVDVEARRARVQPGMVRDELNAALASSGLHFAPETATSDRATIGGMVGNNSAGTRSIRYGQTRDHVAALEVLLDDGERLRFERLDRAGWAAKTRAAGREGAIYRGVSAVIERLRPEIARRFPHVMRRVAGYRLDALAGEPPWSLVDLVVGSEGTLCNVVETELALEPLPAARALVVVCFDTLEAALRAAPQLVDVALPSGAQPTAIELLDHVVLQMARKNPGAGWRYRWYEAPPQGALPQATLPEAILIVELCADDTRTLDADVEALRARSDIGYARVPARGEDQNEVWDVRRSGLGLLAAITAARRPIALIEDAAVPVQALAEYIAGVQALCRELEVEISLYAHASVGLLHVRPLLDLRVARDVELAKRISEGALELTMRHGGSFSGEHGDGRLRSPTLQRFYGEAICDGFAEIKRLFDPRGLLNPGVIVEPKPIDADLRSGPDYHAAALPTRYHYREAGGLATAVELCTGVGACRKVGRGSMCPSFMATRDERDTTRARANALRLAISGQLGEPALVGDELDQAFELCLGCKACKAECPSNVDVARMKSELLAARYDARGAGVADRFYGYSAWAAALSSGPQAALINGAMKLQPLRALLERVVGLDARRSAPTFAEVPLAGRVRQRRAPSGAHARPTVALFCDTYSEHHEPRIGEAALDVIEALGRRAELVAGSCCGRPLISCGFLDDARRLGRRTLERIARQPADVPLIVLEPGCYSALVDDLPDLVDDEALGQAVRARVVDFASWLAREVSGRSARPSDRRFVVHPHCHERALAGSRAGAEALAALGAETRVLDAGCCGMAGAFGYRRATYDVSRVVAEDRL
ncbi:MAG: FAD-binding protein, partial [Myxococcales bacterium]|nr:FAD-binding protein [Myxococcales bacterium]